jgi:hypothetical protein
LAEWEAYDEIEPYELLDEIRTARLMALVASLLGVKDATVQKYLPAHLQPPPPEPETPEARSMRIKAQMAELRKARERHEAERAAQHAHA